jgi:regulator of RNase E activity RraA
MDELLRRLKRLDVCAVSDALDKLGLPPSVSGLSQRSTGKRIAGRVVTYKLVPTSEAPKATVPPRHLGTTAVEAAEAGNIIVVEQRTGIDAGSWGGNLSLGAKQRGVAGVIVDGPVRDVDEARAYEFPVYSRAVTARTARGRVAEAFTNQAVDIGEVRVAPGDYVIADASGVAFVSAADIERVLAVAEAIAVQEADMGKALLEGVPICQVMAGHYENMLNREN